MKTISRFLSLFAAALMAANALGQSPLDNYIEVGLRENIVLKQKQVSYDQARNSLAIARSYFLPSVNFLGDYTSGKGGRSIGIPIGDLLNPVYQSLNQLTGSDAFPMVENVSQNFFPNNFYDVRVRTSLAIVNTDLHINRNIQGQKLVIREFELKAYKRELVYNIKTAYYQYLAACEAKKIYESALTLVSKNVEVNESLVRNGKSLPANLLRSKSELEKIKAELNAASNQVSNAQQYFNFLLNRELETPIETTQVELSNELTTEGSSDAREELLILKTARHINEQALQMNQLSRLPKVNAFLDLGSQASDWKVNGDSKYYLLGVQLSIPVFNGFRVNRNIAQSKLDLKNAELELANVQRQLDIGVTLSENNLRTSIANHEAAKEQLKAARSYYTLTDRGYQEGVNSLIEFIDARNQLTISELQVNLTRYNVLIAQSDLERQTSSYILHN